MNLALNARDAMPEGGRLTISLRRPWIGPENEPLPEMEPGKWICLQVADTGVGMTDEVRDHLFEPFFTTKGPGEGTGLGLAQVYGIVKQHQGFIDVESEPERGTTFRIYLPAAPVYTVADDVVNAAPSQGRGETILLAEDEATVRHATKRILESLGYRVVTAANGREAEELARSAHFDLLLTDLVMPAKGGRELIDALRASHPGLKAIAFTGYAVEDDLHEITVDVLQKPLDIETLGQAVRQALDAE
jgi:CheY-like chemotaxis protein